MRILNERYEQNVPLDTLHDWDGNPNDGDDQAVGESLAETGFYGVLICDIDSRKILAGHTRKRSLLAAGESVAPAVQWVRTDDADHARAVLLGDNRTNRRGQDDRDRLLEALRVQAESARGLAGTGYGQVDVEDLMAQQREAAATAAAQGRPAASDEVPDPPVVPVTKVGDVWLLGEHRLLCGDARDPDAYVRLLGDERADMVWTDPPYGVDYGAKNRFLQTIGRSDRLEEDIEGDGVDPEALGDLLQAAFGSILKATKPGAVWFVAAPPGPPLAVFARELLAIGVWRQLLCWVKNRAVFGRSDYHYQHENLFYGWSPGAAHKPPPTQTGTSLWAYDNPMASKLHPTMKPIALIAQAVENHSVAGDLILDPFSGSGSTLMACESLGRHARAIEWQPMYTDVICARYERHTGTVPILEATGQPHTFVEPT